MPVAILKGTSETSEGCLFQCPVSPKNVSRFLSVKCSVSLTYPRRAILSSQFGWVGEEERGRNFADITGSELE